MELEQSSSPAGSHRLDSQELWQHIWLAKHLLRTVNHEEGLCRVVEGSQVVSPANFGRLLAALVCKGRDSALLFSCVTPDLVIL